MSAPQTARERFEAWLEEVLPGNLWLTNTRRDLLFTIWQAAERSAIERAATVADAYERQETSYLKRAGYEIAQAIRSLIT